ncbi:cytochrome oxidase assembly protein [Natronorubrum sp. JWXQ-INN-674]|uniref:Cytochrome oxidase assembly protein n=1 Tax=Natronorubrum halalkaliphilum TaxID=2691917 RepID=A0A6B0VNV6_9EURY|nr:cytochrome oxidase assembly protein [Natronorubrum halalkaliphilum]MXV63168.1 cytochrome oxidase assembly protein [Natronorubrum halalkaliphilum]
MSTDSHTSRPVVRPLIERFGFPHLLATTLVLVAATILLGVAAKATGSGLACEANWPQCDAGPFNLLPANLPSFYEWFHRFVAMFAGFAIIGTAIAAVRFPNIDKRVAALVVAGMILTPIQVVLGRETVTKYTMDILALHFWTAVLIFVLFVVATVLVWAPRLTATHVIGALALGAVSLPFHVALSPLVIGDITDYSASMQMAQYGVTLALLAAVIVATMVGRRRFERDRLTALLSGTAVLALLVVFLGRRAVMTFNPVLDDLYVGAAALLFVAFVVGIRLVQTASSESVDALSP